MDRPSFSPGKIDMPEGLVDSIWTLDPATSLPSAEVIFGRTEAMKEIHEKALKVADTEVPVLIRGESGTGKEVIAKFMHVHLHWRSGLFVKVHCPAIPESLQEEKRIQVRIVCAKHRPVEQDARKGSFRPDLFYRICKDPNRNARRIPLPTPSPTRKDWIMNLPRRNRGRNLCLVVGMVLITGCVGFLSVKSEAEPAGFWLFHKLGQSPKDSSAPGGAPAARPASDNDPYTIGPEDVLKIDVWHEPEFSSVVAVRPDGKISLPLVGDLTASGLTPKKLQETLTDKLQAFISNPAVVVTVQEVKSRKFNVLGEVQHPGSYSLAQPVRVLDAIGMAGGFRDFAKVTKIYVLRQTANGESLHIPINYKQVIKGIDVDQNVQLEPGDTLVVP